MHATISARLAAPLVASAALSLGLAFALPAMGAAPAKAPTAAKATPAKPAAAKPAVKAPAKPAIDATAVKALQDMSAFLQSQQTIKIVSQTSLDVVTNSGERIQLDGEATYKVRKPDAFVIDLVSDTWNREYLYNGKEFTLYAPKLGFFATAAAPPTIQATLTEIGEKYGISIPLDDLFRWSGSDGTRADRLDSAYHVGTATLGGVKADHYAFREGKIDWQIWIQQGPQPLPLKLVIIDHKDPAGPAYTARLSWTLNPPLTDADFAFRPAPEAKRIRITLQNQ